MQALVFARARPVAARLRPHPHHHDRLGHHYHQHPRDPVNNGADGGSGTDPGTGTTCSLRGVRDSGRSGDGHADGDRGDDDQVDGYDDRIMPFGADGGEKEAPEEAEEGGGEGDDDGDDEMSADEKASRERWLVSGGKDGRVVVWALMDFARVGHHQKGRAP